MLKDEIKDIHRNIRETVDELEHYVEREKDYYKQYRNII